MTRAKNPREFIPIVVSTYKGELLEEYDLVAIEQTDLDINDFGYALLIEPEQVQTYGKYMESPVIGFLSWDESYYEWLDQDRKLKESQTSLEETLAQVAKEKTPEELNELLDPLIDLFSNLTKKL
jgi:hypothetical protein